MQEVYISLEEAAELESIDYETLKKRLQREPNDFKHKRESNTVNGGKERIFIALSSLSKKARNQYRERQNVDISKLSNVNEDASVPWYVYADWAWYRENHKQHYSKALGLLKHVEDCVGYDGWKDKTEYIAEYAKELGLTQSSLYRKIRSYTAAVAWSKTMGRNDNVNYDYFKILALCPQPRTPAGRHSLSDEMKAVIENIWFNPDFAVNLCKKAKLYRTFKEHFQKKYPNEYDLPSYDTVCRYIDDIRKTTDNDRVLLTKGKREWQRTVMVKRRRSLKELKVMELVVADTHTFDCFVTVTSANGSERIVKPCLVGFMDMRSRALVGWCVCEVPDSRIIKETLIHMILPSKNNPFEGVPRILLIDNGKDYTAHSLTGRPRRVRVELDQDTEGLYREIGIERDMRSLPYHSWVKAEIERFFGTVCEDFSKTFKSYVGTLTGEKTSAKVVKNIKQLHARGELKDMKEFAGLFEHWVLNDYSTRPHSGLKEQKENPPTPLGIYETAEVYFKPAPPHEYLKRIAMVREKRMVYPTGIRMLGCNYMSDDLNPYIHKTVTVRYDHRDASTVYAYDEQTDILIGEAKCLELLNVIAPVGDKALEEHMRAQKRQYRKANENIGFYQMPYEQRMNPETIEHKAKAAVYPEPSEESRKAVSIPKNKAYLNDNPTANKQNERTEMNSFMRSQAEKAFRELMQMGG